MTKKAGKTVSKRIVRGGGAGRKPGDPNATTFVPRGILGLFGGKPKPMNIGKANKPRGPGRGEGTTVDPKGPRKPGRQPPFPGDDGDHFREA